MFCIQSWEGRDCRRAILHREMIELVRRKRERERDFSRSRSQLLFVFLLDQTRRMTNNINDCCSDDTVYLKVSYFQPAGFYFLIKGLRWFMF